MTVQELKRRVADGYDVDPRLVADALLRRNGLQNIASAIAGDPLVTAGGRTRGAGASRRQSGPGLAPS